MTSSKQSSHSQEEPSSHLQQQPSSISDNHKNKNKPLFTAGILADIQYAPVEDGYSYSGVPRYYKHALQAAGVAAAKFQEEQCDFVLQLGDIIDGKCQSEECKLDNENNNPGLSAIMEVVDALSVYNCGPVIHTYGNHELYNLSREQLGSILKIPFVTEPCGDMVGYYSFKHDRSNVRFVILDSYDISSMQRCSMNSLKRKEAEVTLKNKNPNFPQKENSPEGLDGVARRYVGFNGGVGKHQLVWLRDTLKSAKRSGEKVIVLSHQPILPGSTSPVTLMWNYSDVLEVLREFSCTVIASFSGHAHKGGYKRCDVSGIHFRIIEAVLESPDPYKTFGLLDFYEDRIEIRGEGRCESAVYDFAHMKRTVHAVFE